ncbi:AfsR/SARP family transcriptional regulator [Micromonospora phytophila]|uniref:AfsR/SARP family transcriptional regulator n=1 Tax=Micromonospora phytophila TaxID=709888 RepID=UPI00202DB6BC|nr:AfsR/SARP family transcriptional regulator [Micromonospora phytophila]MCM0674807.1 AfsR/SARP family transcriptional regulator [Micromonospora phytophila]
MQLRVDGRIVTPGARKRRAMLAGLALAANRSMSLNRLAEMVWADAPPASAMANLRSHAAGIRRLIGHRLVARPNAYELRLEPHELDVIEFQRLAEEGRSRLTTEDPTSAIPTLTAALAHWRGAAGEGLPGGTTLDSRWASLEEQRLQVFEELTEARLTAGKHGDVLSELREHLAAHPLRERAWGQLMLALYRCGDVPAALGAYRDARARMDEQLGIKPGEELDALHRAILNRAPQVSYTRPTAVTATSPTPVGEHRTAGVPGWTVPRELPADLATLVGRTAETADVVAALTSATPSVVVITGPPGSGKTALAVRTARAVAAGFPHGQVFVDLGYRTSVTSDEVLGRVLRALGVAAADVPDDTDERAGWFRSLAAGRRLLLAIDGVTRAAQVRPLLPAGPGPALIVVGQRRLRSLEGARRITLPPLTATRAGALLAALAGPGRMAAEPAATAELVRLCAGSVLALRIAGSRLARWPEMPVAALVNQLAEGRGRLDLLTYDDLSVRASLAAGVAVAQSEDEVAGRLLELLGTCPEGPAEVDRAAAQLGVSSHRVRQALEDLVDAHLVHRDGPGSYRLPALVRDFAAEMAAEPLTPVQDKAQPIPYTG